MHLSDWHWGQRWVARQGLGSGAPYLESVVGLPRPAVQPQGSRRGLCHGGHGDHSEEGWGCLARPREEGGGTWPMACATSSGTERKIGGEGAW
jgi:hypothetical protein